MSKIYLDYAATTPVDKHVIKTMRPFFDQKYGNPGSLHAFGQEAIKAVDESRETIAVILNTSFRNIIFTGSATEANNLIIRGVVKKTRGMFKKIPRIIISDIEHESIYETVNDLARVGEAEVIIIPVDSFGTIDLEDIKNNLTENTALVSIIYVNNEIGTVAQIKEISETVVKFKSEHGLDHYPLFHTDAVQAFQYYECDVNALGVDALTLSSHKLYGPKGIGVLYCGEENIISPLVTGGGQEFGLRSGTEATHQIIGCSKAISISNGRRVRENKRVRGLMEELWEGLKRTIPEIRINGLPLENNNHSPHILSIFISGWEDGSLVTALDIAGFAVSAGPACAARSQKVSRIIQSLGFSEEHSRGSIRVSIGADTTNRHIKSFVSTLSRLNKESNKNKPKS